MAEKNNNKFAKDNYNKFYKKKNKEQFYKKKNNHNKQHKNNKKIWVIEDHRSPAKRKNRIRIGD